MKNPFARNRQQETARGPNSPPSSGSVKAKTEKYKWAGYLNFSWMPRKFENQRQIDITQFQYYSTNDVLDQLRYNHPETSFSIWQFLRVANSGIELDAKKLTGEHSDRGQRVLDQLAWKLNHPPNGNQFEEARGLDLIAGQLFINAMFRGGVGSELVLNELGRMDRIQVFDTATFYLQSEGGRLVPYQWQAASKGTGYEKIDYPTIFYVPLDPAPDDPYGASPLISLIQVVAWQMGFLNDLQAAVHATGYPRMKVKLLEEIARKNAPLHVQNDPTKYKDWMDKIRTDVQATMTNLEPDSIPVMWDSAELDLVAGGGGGTIKVDAVITTINKSLAAALKTLSSIIGMSADTSKESYAAELKLYSRGIESVQKIVKTVLERALTMALNLEGVQGFVEVRFKPVDLRSDFQIIAEVQTFQDVLYAARDEGDINDEERTKLMRDKLGLVGKPTNWDELQTEREGRRANGTQPERRHGSPPATQ